MDTLGDVELEDDVVDSEDSRDCPCSAAACSRRCCSLRAALERRIRSPRKIIRTRSIETHTMITRVMNC